MSEASCIGFRRQDGGRVSCKLLGARVLEVKPWMVCSYKIRLLT